MQCMFTGVVCEVHLQASLVLPPEAASRWLFDVVDPQGDAREGEVVCRH